MTIDKRNITDVGQLNKRITFQEKGAVSDGMGGSDYTWVDWVSVWASVSDMGGVQYQNRNQHTETVHNLKFIVRYNDRIYSKPITDMRIVYLNRGYRIRNIQNLNQMEYYLEITCDGNEWEAVG